MNDYKELVAELKEEWNACDRLISDKIAINLEMLTKKHYVTLAEDCCDEMVGIMQTIDCAINAIEQLVTDYEILAKMYAKVNEDLCVRTKERDAAVESLRKIGECCDCKHYYDAGENDCPYLNNCGNKWEWRGVQEDNDEID